jgi:plastocyanin
MVNVKDKRCAQVGCDIRPSFNKPGETQGLFCAVHKKDGMVDVKNKRCAHADCDTTPNFNTPGETRGLYCAVHKNDGMVDVKTKRCAHVGCDKLNPTFNTPGETRGLFCAVHKNDGMVNVKNKRCAHVGCSKQPTFNTPGEIQGLYCVSHKKDGMVNVKDKRCAHTGCDKLNPAFNTPGETRGLYCAVHKKDGMVNVKSRRCAHVGCDTIPCFGFPGLDPTRCKQHMEENMIANPKSTCKYDKCKEPALYGISRPERCEQHKETFHLNWVERKCVQCGLLNILNKQDTCYLCDPDEFNRTRLAKQNQIKNMLVVNGYHYVSCDNMIEHGHCFKYRPDFMFDCGTHYVVLEVDENQHQNYSYECEEVRMINIFQSIGMPTKFIRYNSDEYEMNHRKHNPTFNQRTKLLTCALNSAFEERPIGHLSVKYMFYDNLENSQFEEMDLGRFKL